MTKALIPGLAAPLLFFANTAHSAVINVTSTVDALETDGFCTLREAVIAANSDAAYNECAAGLGPDTILLSAPGTYTLAIAGKHENASLTGDLDITQDLVIEGGDAETYIIDAAALDRVFEIHGDFPVTFRGITITGGAIAADGGGINGRGILTIEDTIVENNQAFPFDPIDIVDGGGIYYLGEVPGSTLSLTRTIVRNNTTTSRGGGIYAAHLGDMTVSDSVIQGNSAGDQGGGLHFSLFNSLSVTDTLMSDNSTPSEGGAIYLEDGDVTIDNTTFDKNSATAGGAVFVFSGAHNTVIQNSTFHENTAPAGGGIRISFNEATVQQVTLDQRNTDGSSAVSMDNGILNASNTLFLGACDGGLATSLGGNIESPGDTCGLADASDLNSITESLVNLQPLQDNGGKTPTQLPGFDSVLIEGALLAECATADQRAVTRPVDFDGIDGPECDVGAVELTACTQHETVLTLDSGTTWITPLFQACEKIEAGDGFAVTEAGTIMRAGNAVVFGPLFSVQNGASLSVQIDWGFWESAP